MITETQKNGLKDLIAPHQIFPERNQHLYPTRIFASDTRNRKKKQGSTHIISSWCPGLEIPQKKTSRHEWTSLFIESVIHRDIKAASKSLFERRT